MSRAPRPQWNVVVWNDQINLMIYVVWVFRHLLDLSQQPATNLMMQVHEGGRAIVHTAPREQAEMVAFHLHHHGLRTTLEQS